MSDNHGRKDWRLLLQLDRSIADKWYNNKMTTKRPNPIFVKQGADVLADIDERDVRIVGADTKKTFLTSLGGYSNYTSGNTSGVVEVVDPGVDVKLKQVSLLTPQIGDVTIVSRTINYSTTPPTVDVLIKVKNSTNAVVKGINARITN